MQDKLFAGKTISAIVREDYRAAEVFRRHGINYCCGGQATLSEACGLKGTDMAVITEELNRATTSILLPNNLRYDTWKTGFLIDYIINVHHSYLRAALPQVQATLQSFVNSHKKQHPGLEQVAETFRELADLLLAQSQEEEASIFPYIKQLESMYRRRETYGSLFVRTLRKPLEDVSKAHRRIESLVKELRSLTGFYTFRENACANHRVVFHQLREFDQDLAQHKYLENSVLFPKALEMENELLAMQK